jgi:hypothetical protein
MTHYKLTGIFSIMLLIMQMTVQEWPKELTVLDNSNIGIAGLNPGEMMNAILCRPVMSEVLHWPDPTFRESYHVTEGGIVNFYSTEGSEWFLMYIFTSLVRPVKVDRNEPFLC